MTTAAEVLSPNGSFVGRRATGRRRMAETGLWEPQRPGFLKTEINQGLYM